ncbi:hypothetical protein HPC38_01125 [Pasteurellaceae bacterium HPA106]|uniref:hypothetical protein n=1 Tax=Spirabiliibacterium pneumoniae TaxID=221400 RepID=UPI001AADB6B9|nr:hypothetical protein [Spirabiliibacterium pneumoniae]MBE2895483.1 hypothetical protein [Spirabiliibacterium pneumoniae]
MGRARAIYAVYKGEQNLADGTLDELSAKMNMTVNTLRYLSGKAYRRRIGDRLNNRLLLIKIGTERDEGEQHD